MNMKNWTIGKRIVLLASLLCLLSVVISVASILGMRNILTEGRAVSEKSLPAVIQTSTMNYLPMINMVRLYRLLDPISETERKAIEDATLADTTKFRAADKIYEATITSPAERAEYEKLGVIHEHYLSLRAQYLDLVATNREAARKILTVDMVAALNDFSTQTLSMMDQHAEDGAANGKQLVSSVREISIILVIVSVVGVIFGVVLAIIIVRSTNQRLEAVAGSLSDGSNQVSSASGQVTSASQSLAEGSSAQASSLEETSSSLEEMSSMTKRNAENARKANELAKEARTAADKGVGDMQTMGVAMEAIKVSSDDIAKIIKTIDEIAFQTNILALNAAVEAARAGEAGMGFAVVADEVRNLAQRCAQAAKETASKIEGAIVKTGQGVEISSKVALALNEIVTKVRQVDDLVTEVANASAEQTQGITQINSAMGQMDKITQSNAATAEESAAAAEELNAQAEVMKQSVTELLQLVSGQNQTGAKPSAAPRRAPARSAKPAGPRLAPLPVNGNGHAHPQPAAAGKSRSAIPMAGDFKDF
jgi:methyl-accepting chemotaxis protein